MATKENSIHGILYYSLLGLCISIFIGFSYLSFLAYTVTQGTPYFLLSYIIIAPVFVAAFLLILLVAVGKAGFYRELQQLKMYKVST